MSHIGYFLITKPLKIVTKDPYNHTFILVHMFFDIRFDLSRKLLSVLGVYIIGSVDKDSYYGMVNINNDSMYFFIVNINELEESDG